MMQLESKNPRSAAGHDESCSPKIEFNNVSKSFGDLRVLDGLNWSVPTGAVVGLLGLNGSGKSTLIQCMLGLLRPDAGQINIAGEDVWDLSDNVKSKIGFVDQKPVYYPWMNGKQILSYVGSFYPSWNQELVLAIADDWEVPLKKTFGTLSPGQQHKVAILAAMGNEPDLLVLDEPVSSLDPLARRDFLRSILDVAKEPNRTVLLSTHITSDLERVASHVAVLNAGRIQWFDELDEVKDRVKSVRIRGRASLPAHLEIPGAIRVTQTGDVATVIVQRWGDAMQQRLQQQFDADIEVEDLNLEEIFLAIHE